eukprot:193352-Hanusia_phi.AAC.1
MPPCHRHRTAGRPRRTGSPPPGLSPARLRQAGPAECRDVPAGAGGASERPDRSTATLTVTWDRRTGGHGPY